MAVVLPEETASSQIARRTRSDSMIDEAASATESGSLTPDPIVAGQTHPECAKNPAGASHRRLRAVARRALTSVLPCTPNGAGQHTAEAPYDSA